MQNNVDIRSCKWPKAVKEQHPRDANNANRNKFIAMTASIVKENVEDENSDDDGVILFTFFMITL